MRTIASLYLVAVVTLAASTAWATGPVAGRSGADLQAHARSLARETAVSAYQRGPATVAVKALPSTERRGTEVKSGNSTFTWRGSADRGRVTVDTRLSNGGRERIEQKRGFFRNSGRLERETHEKLPDGTNVKTETTAETKRTFWTRQVKRTETTKVTTTPSETDYANGVETRTFIKINDSKKNGREVSVSAVTTKGSDIFQTGKDKGARAVIAGPQGKEPKPVVSDFQPVNTMEQLRKERMGKSYDPSDYATR